VQVTLRSGDTATAKAETAPAVTLLFAICGRRVVALSACEMARGGYGPGEGLVGMRWALLAAGAPRRCLGRLEG
jgi:hypothetical protein